ncbi:hypothetical protein EVAR_16323_1 [Eumeta japonica]|uniref:Uncharacterized protein n=1 Tax=Eumeta variegata TaxID=151549 RepID=A0A4C1VE62_EUMVA|nr:hypothetical protein EVAR_16323_1 [Eumeta japonica]
MMDTASSGGIKVGRNSSYVHVGRAALVPYKVEQNGYTNGGRGRAQSIREVSGAGVGGAGGRSGAGRRFGWRYLRSVYNSRRACRSARNTNLIQRNLIARWPVLRPIKFYPRPAHATNRLRVLLIDKRENELVVTIEKRHEQQITCTPMNDQPTNNRPLSIHRAIRSKVCEDDLCLLVSNGSLAEQYETTLSSLKNKHPAPSRNLSLSLIQDSSYSALSVNVKDVFKALNAFYRISLASSRNQTRPQYLKELCPAYVGDNGSRLLEGSPSRSRRPARVGHHMQTLTSTRHATLPVSETY